jgi:predicted DNA-binding transcriptional regulator
MANDRALGGIILAGSIIGIIVYGTLLWFWALIILEITAFLGVIVLLGILGWIGWTMATTPPPEPMPEMTGAGGQSSTPSTSTGTGAADKKPSG